MAVFKRALLSWLFCTFDADGRVIFSFHFLSARRDIMPFVLTRPRKQYFPAVPYLFYAVILIVFSTPHMKSAAPAVGDRYGMRLNRNA